MAFPRVFFVGILVERKPFRMRLRGSHQEDEGMWYGVKRLRMRLPLGVPVRVSMGIRVSRVERSLSKCFRNHSLH